MTDATPPDCGNRSSMQEQRMSQNDSDLLSKVPAVTLGFWIIKILATTLGETGGDTVSMTMNLGYLVGTGIFASIFVGLVVEQIKSKHFHPFVYWATIIASTTARTTKHSLQ
jgi:uncharacterized membrane-anchored protein